ncbi:MAG: AI-2E family transporter [Planctomycetaceae bacterium]|nr:AI-2E family transporter [Planctomycetaceae bacterium]
MLKNKQEIERIAGLAFVALVIIGCVVILRSFASAIIWAAVLCFATWPAYELLLKWLGGRRNLAAGLMTLILVLVLLTPFVIVGVSFTDNIQSGLEWLNTHKHSGVPALPEWVSKIPLIGPKAAASWQDLSVNAGPVLERMKPWAHKAGLWLLGHSIDFAKGVFYLALSLLIAFFMYRDGRDVALRLSRGFQQISGDYAQRLLEVVTTTVKSVVYGVIGTGLVQGVVAAIGFAVAGVPSPVLLGLLTFFMSFIPAGPVIVWLGAAIHLFAHQRIGWGIFMVLYGILLISSIDNLIKPYIFSRGSKLSFILMLLGMLGGIASFGFIGVFLGPVLLAVGYSLIKEFAQQTEKKDGSLAMVEP